MYSVNYSKTAIRELEKMDSVAANMIVAWIEKNLIGCDNPRAFGIALTDDQKGHQRYRVGSYRLIAKISDTTITISIINIAHRKEVYK